MGAGSSSIGDWRWLKAICVGCLVIPFEDSVSSIHSQQGVHHACPIHDVDIHATLARPEIAGCPGGTGCGAT